MSRKQTTFYAFAAVGLLMLVMIGPLFIVTSAPIPFANQTEQRQTLDAIINPRLSQTARVLQTQLASLQAPVLGNSLYDTLTAIAVSPTPTGTYYTDTPINPTDQELTLEAILTQGSPTPSDTPEVNTISPQMLTIAAIVNPALTATSLAGLFQTATAGLNATIKAAVNSAATNVALGPQYTAGPTEIQQTILANVAQRFTQTAAAAYQGTATAAFQGTVSSLLAKTLNAASPTPPIPGELIPTEDQTQLAGTFGAGAAVLFTQTAQAQQVGTGTAIYLGTLQSSINQTLTATLAGQNTPNPDQVQQTIVANVNARFTETAQAQNTQTATAIIKSTVEFGIGQMLTATKDTALRNLAAGLDPATTGNAAQMAEIETLQGHAKTVWGVAFSPDGNQIASASQDGTVRLWDVTAGVERVLMKGSSDRQGVAFSPDGKYIASVSSDKTVRLWETGTVSEKTIFKGHTNSVTSLAFSPDGKMLATGSTDRTIRLWDAGGDGGKSLAVLTGHLGSVLAVAFSPDGTRIISGSTDGTIRIWETKSGLSIGTLKGHTGAVLGVTYNNTGTRIASAGADGSLRLWNADTLASIVTAKGPNAWLTSIAYNPAGTLIATGSKDGTLWVWDADSATKLAILKGHDKWVTSVAFSPDNARLVSGSDDTTVRVWAVKSGQ